MLIAVSGQDTEAVCEFQLRRLLDNIWNCMVLILGIDELVNVRNVERLKRDLRLCYQLIDGFLEASGEWMGDVTHCVDCLLPPQLVLLQEALDAFSHAAESEFGCLLVHGKVVAATEKWWRLAPQEVVLLTVLLRSLGGTACCDQPVFLPQGSPTVPHRLLRFQLLPGADVCVLCGPSPSLQRAEIELVGRFWRPLMEILWTCLALKDHCLPGSVTLHKDVLGLLLINRESSRAISSVRSAVNPPGAPSVARRWELLRLFFIFTVKRYFVQDEVAQRQKRESLQEEFALGFSHQPIQCYMVTEECKCFGLQTPHYQLYLLMPFSVPTFALRPLAARTLSTLTATGF
ncbi:protein fuzzy-like [Scleropages formosus]|uniref:Protein fuzzy-like n=3 Tax=Scleropages formosus TaxID=113540 RepID=A0A0P7W7X6_SCLFO|nr:protein fuzzy-like [Scleropages formosus]